MDDVADESHSGTLELLIVLVPVFGDTGLGLEPLRGFLSVQVVDAALGLGPLLLLALGSPCNLLYLSKATMEENEKAKAQREQRRVSHSGVITYLLR